jgi:cytochrome b561
MAILIIASLAMVEIADVAPRGSGLCAALREWHAQAGLAVLALIWFRIAWRMTGSAPGIVPRPAAWQRTCSGAAHG